MPPVRTNQRPASPVEAYVNSYSLYPTSPSATTTQYSPVSPASTETNASPPAKKKRSHGKARPPGHIPRPPNAFIIFRTDYIKSMSTHSTPEVSKNLGEKWKNMTDEEKRPWIEKAQEAKAEHKEKFPDYKYKPVHPRDAEGRCIRKKRKPNQPRVKNTEDILEHLPVSFRWMEKLDAEFPSTSLPSDTSSVSSPPRSPSPATSTFNAYLYPSHQAYRRSSSVPIPSPDGRFFFGTAPAYPPPPSSAHTGHVSRRLSNRPSTSVDFTSGGPIQPELYAPNNGAYLSPGDVSQWRIGHRRSISAPGFGMEIPTAQFAHTLSYNLPQQVNPLTPIDPAFGNVFDKFSWNATPSAPHAPESYVMPPLHPYANVDIASMTNKPASNLSGALTPCTSTPGLSPSPSVIAPEIQHPAPVASFDFSAFHEYDAASFVQEERAYSQAQSRDAQFYPVEVQGTEQPYDGETQVPEDRVENTYAQADLDLQCYNEGLRYTRPEVAPPHPLDFNELIVEGY